MSYLSTVSGAIVLAINGLFGQSHIFPIVKYRIRTGPWAIRTEVQRVRDGWRPRISTGPAGEWRVHHAISGLKKKHQCWDRMSVHD